MRAALFIFLTLVACGGSDETAPLPENEVEAFMTRYFQVFDSYVTDDILALYAEDVSAEITGLGTLSGRDAVRDEWLLPFTSAFPDYTHEVNAVAVEGERATADFVFSGTHQGELLGNEPTGKELVLPIAGSYDVAGGAVRWLSLDYDLAVVLAAITP
jgi:predicted ester cyclase